MNQHIREITISKSVKITRKVDNDYHGIEPMMSMTIENPTEKDVKESWAKINQHLTRELDIDPDWIRKEGGEK
uniref:Uncharacterized protein n=1 Tax=viral metagenome TaxID=1070528 RepID=A0A6H2A395_9ZZZZ